MRFGCNLLPTLAGLQKLPTTTTFARRNNNNDKLSPNLTQLGPTQFNANFALAECFTLHCFAFKLSPLFFKLPLASVARARVSIC